jgi:hypothetical protein
MIGEDQAKGYPEETKVLCKEDNKNFEEAQKQVKESLGIKDGEKLSPEQIKQMAMEAMSDKRGNIEHKINNMEKDLMIIRKQVNEMVIVLNKVQLGFVSKLSEMQGRIDSKLDDIKRGLDKRG